MITVLEGEDLSAIHSYLVSVKKRYTQNSTYEFAGYSKNSEQILECLSSVSIFSDKLLVIIKILPNENIDAWILKYIDDDSSEILMYGSLNARYSEIKELKKTASIKTFSKKDPQVNFDLCTAIFLDRNKAESIRIINNESKWEELVYPLVPLMQTYVRNLISQKYNNEIWKKLNPYFKAKFTKSNQKFEEGELVVLFDKLLELDIASKTQSAKKIKALLQDFVIYSI